MYGLTGVQRQTSRGRYQQEREEVLTPKQVTQGHGDKGQSII